MNWVEAGEAVAVIAPGQRVVLPQGCIEPWSIFDALAESRGFPENPPTLYSGLQFGDYRFLGPRDTKGHDTGGMGPGYRYVTWQVGAAIRSLAAQGGIGFLPLRFGDIPRFFGSGGTLQRSGLLGEVVPAEIRGRCSSWRCWSSWRCSSWRHRSSWRRSSQRCSSHST